MHPTTTPVLAQLQSISNSPGPRMRNRVGSGECGRQPRLPSSKPARSGWKLTAPENMRVVGGPRLGSALGLAGPLPGCSAGCC